MKQNRRKRFIAAAAAGLLAAAVFVTAVLGRAIEAEAAETFLGIEKLREEVAKSGKEYTVLEIVPDRAAAEIGFFFDGYEPILSSWDEEKMEWKSWRETLCGLPTFEERKNYIEALKIKLKEYYEKQGMDSRVPVKYFEEVYEESEILAEGFEKIEAGGIEKTGWFTKTDIPEGAERYQLSFQYMGKYPQNYEEEEDYLYYTIDGTPIEITAENRESIAADAYVYKWEGEEGVFSIAGTWEQLKESALDEVETDGQNQTEESTTETAAETESSGKQEETTTEPEGTTEEEGTKESESPSESETSSEPESASTPESSSEPESSSQPESRSEPESPSQPESRSEPESPSQPESRSEPESPSQPESASEPESSLQPGNNEQEPESPVGGETGNSTSAALPIHWQRLSADLPADGQENVEEPKESEQSPESSSESSPEQNPESSPEQSPESSPESRPETESETRAGTADEEPAGTEPETSETETESIEPKPFRLKKDETELNKVANTAADTPAEEDTYYLVSFKRVEDYSKLADNTTIYIVRDITRSTNGEYAFIESSDENQSRQTYVFNGITIYCKNTFKNNEWFKKNALDMDGDYKKFPVKVLTYTPAQLNAMAELPAFDFLYLNSGDRIVSIQETPAPEEPETETPAPAETEAPTPAETEAPTPAETEAPKSEEPEVPAGQITSAAGYDAEGMDLSAELTNRLFERIVAGAVPCLVDGGILFENITGEDTTEETMAVREAYKGKQIFRLAAMLCQQDLEQWYDANKGNMSGVSAEKLLEGFPEDADKNFATGQVYCRFQTNSIVNSDFAAATIYQTGKEVEQGFQKVLDEIELENLYRDADNMDSGESRPMLSTDISQARVLRHIINYKNRRNVETKQTIKVLEIQPALTTGLTAGYGKLTEEQVREWAPGIETVEIETMTTAEFIGKIEKLNEIYDLIYIGTSKEHLNISNWVTDTGTSSDNKFLGSTVFNDSDMDGLIYYNIGDLRVVDLPMGGLLDTEYKNNDRDEWTYYYNWVRYGGNDITEDKMNALYSFLDGSYPIIVSDEFIEQPVTVFETRGYTGRSAALKEGIYTKDELLGQQIYAGGETADKKISGIKVKEGYQVTIYAKEKLTGEHLEIIRKADGYYVTRYDSKNRVKGSTVHTNSADDLSAFKTADNKNTWDNRCNSMKVEKSEGAQPARAVDSDHIDNCTYLYEFVDTALKKNYTNFYVEGDIDENGSELLKFYLNRPKADLVNFTANGTKEEGSADNVYFIQSDVNGNYTLNYRFTIQNEGAASAGSRYECKLYIDVNADGKFSGFEEVGDISLTHNGAGVAADELYAGNEYVLTRQVPPGYKGLLPWKVEVCQKDNSNVYASQIGYTKLKGMKPEELRICQIYYPNLKGIVNLQTEIANEDTYFHDLIYGDGVNYKGITDDFTLNVTTITISDYENEIKKNPDYLKQFNMLILGFSDMYGNFSGSDTEGAMGAIVEFIRSGKSVLMAHDTTSFFNNPIKNNGQKGYPKRDTNDAINLYGEQRFAAGLNQYIRPLAGMDRYGILGSGVLQRGTALTEGSDGWNEVVNSGKDVAYKPKSGRKETVSEVHGYNYSTISAKDYKVNVVTNEKGEITYEKDYSTINTFDRSHMFTTDRHTENGGDIPSGWSFKNLYRNIRYDYVNDGSSSPYYGEMVVPSNGEVNNLQITQVNEGQITEYPYKLEEKFTVAKTHAQYYELDYTADDDGDGESDLVVWYCLGKGDNGNRETVYSQSPNDVRNNYYIYNKGNITYTGMGHSAPNYTLEEAKLFINTMIASYQAGVKQPYISIKENQYPESAQLRAMYRYTDTANGISLSDAATAEPDEKIYFTVQDINFVKGTRKITSHVYYEASDGTEEISVDGNTVKVTKLEDRIFDANTGAAVDANNLTSGGMYYILVPKTVMKKCESGPLNLYFEAQSTITTNTSIVNVYVTDKVYAKLEVMQAYLFELD